MTLEKIKRLLTFFFNFWFKDTKKIQLQNLPDELDLPKISLIFENPENCGASQIVSVEERIQHDKDGHRIRSVIIEYSNELG